jgi:hypothetical protein
MLFARAPSETNTLHSRIGSLDKEMPNIQRKQRKAREKKENDIVRTQIAEVQSGKTTSDRNQTVGEVERVFMVLNRIYKKMKNGNYQKWNSSGAVRLLVF